MNDLERALLELDVQWPATPDLATAVMTRIAAEPREAAGGGAAVARGEAAGGGSEAARGEAAGGGGGARRRAPWRRLPAFGAGWRARAAYVAAALAVLVGGTLAVSPEARSTVLRWLGLGSVEIKREPLPAGVVRGLDLGTPIALPRGAPVPRELGEPDAVYATPLPEGTRAVSLVYAGPPPVLVQTFRATVTPFIQKTVGSAADVESLRIDGAQAYWITGSHGFAFQTAASVAYEDQRLADRTLLVERDGLLIRVEGAISRERAVEIARDTIR